MASQTDETELRVWAVIGARAGDNDQVIALAQALGIPFEVKHLEYRAFRYLGPHLLGRSLISLRARSRETILSEPPPDVTISAGHRSVPVIQALRHRSGGRTRSIHVGFPRVSPGKFDLVIATPQYPISSHPNLLRVPYALTKAASTGADAADHELLKDLPRPMRLLIVGGQSLYWTIDQRALDETLRQALSEGEASGGSVVVTTSPRTPAAVRQRLADALGASPVPSMLAVPGRPPRYASLLDAASSIRVTADSVAMVSDAIWTAKPLALVPVKKTALGRVAMGLGDLISPSERVYPQDLRFFWRSLAKIGITETLAAPKTSTAQEMRRLIDRVQPILNAARAGLSSAEPQDGSQQTPRYRSA